MTKELKTSAIPGGSVGPVVDGAFVVGAAIGAIEGGFPPSDSNAFDIWIQTSIKNSSWVAAAS